MKRTRAVVDTHSDSEDLMGVERVLKRVRRSDTTTTTTGVMDVECRCNHCLYLERLAQLTGNEATPNFQLVLARFVECPHALHSYTQALKRTAPLPKARERAAVRTKVVIGKKQTATGTAATIAVAESDEDTVDGAPPTAAAASPPTESEGTAQSTSALETVPVPVSLLPKPVRHAKWRPDDDLSRFLARKVEPTRESVMAMYDEWRTAYPMENLPGEGWVYLDESWDPVRQDKRHDYYFNKVLQESVVSGSGVYKPFFEGFDAPRAAKEASERRYSEYYNMEVPAIRKIWDVKRDMGTAYHHCIEDMVCGYKDGVAPKHHYDKDHPELYKDEPPLGFYEFCAEFPYLRIIRVEVKMGHEGYGLASACDALAVDLRDHSYWLLDWKNTKAIYEKSFGDVPKFGTHPLTAHMPDCNYWHYAIQLNTYSWLLDDNFGIEVLRKLMVNFPPPGTKQRRDETKHFKYYDIPDVNVVPMLEHIKAKRTGQPPPAVTAADINGEF